MSSKQKLLGNCSRGLLFVVSAPAGTGKSTLVDRLTREFDTVRRSISCTTRPKRAGEVDGVDYHFVSQELFDQRVTERAFLEYVSLFGYAYGTIKEDVEAMLRIGQHVVLVIDTQGAEKLMNEVQAIYIFIMPPSAEVLSSRLSGRGTESEESISRRLAEAQREMSCRERYNYCIVNDDIDIAYQVLRSIVIAEEHKIRNKYGI